MDESEKLTALKKAYADIILNTAKEAAARIMVSERKAIRFQQELVSTKEEALRMLLRLKQMLDSKVSEAEVTSLSQQKKIEELEAQLQEAEEIVRDLRAELREVQAELDKITNHQMHPLDEQTVEGETEIQEEILKNTIPHGSLYSVPVSQFELVTSHDTTSGTVNGMYEGNKCNVALDHIYNYINSPDFPSIVIRRKEPELYRNGCTQRIRASERNLFGGKFSLSGKVDDSKNETLTRAGEEAEVICAAPSQRSDSMYEAEKNVDELKVRYADDCHMKFKLPAIKSFHKKRRATRYRKGKAPSSRSHLEKAIETLKASQLSSNENSAYIVDNNDQKGGNSSKICETPVSPSSHKPCLPTEMIKQSGFVDITDTDEQFLKPCNGWNKVNNDKELMDKSDLTRQESLSAETLEVPACKEDVETANDSLDNMAPKASDPDEKVSGQSADNKFLKYTFRRKRKKECLSSPDGDVSLEKSCLKKKAEEKQNDNVEAVKSCVPAESSRDSRRLAQVARQLISLSEKKWWQ
ncbi:Nuclear mitotic apparatus 1 [Quillaja saponaria]|uniref:Nuclear mitotic apparatus 1 n=1 Tax=Quillaja saponaria TaxID=32244 RepID=A0AAD7LED1_QUISA|nr:Nuclear mitotic apparatus 1 [Quillaja saponaria]